MGCSVPAGACVGFHRRRRVGLDVVVDVPCWRPAGGRIAPREPVAGRNGRPRAGLTGTPGAAGSATVGPAFAGVVRACNVVGGGGAGVRITAAGGTGRGGGRPRARPGATGGAVLRA